MHARWVWMNSKNKKRGGVGMVMIAMMKPLLELHCSLLIAHFLFSNKNTPSVTSLNLHYFYSFLNLGFLLLSTIIGFPTFHFPYSFLPPFTNFGIFSEFPHLLCNILYMEVSSLKISWLWSKLKPTLSSLIGVRLWHSVVSSFNLKEDKRNRYNILD